MATPDKPRRRGRPKDPNSKRSRGEDRHTLPRVVVHLPQSLLDLIVEDATAEDRTRTAQVLRILKAHYQEAGRWPPPSDPA